MKKYLAMLLMLTMISSFFTGCGIFMPRHETEFLNVSIGNEGRQEWSSEYYRVVATTSYPVVGLGYEDGEKYPALYAKIANRNYELKEECLKEYDDLKESGYYMLSQDYGYYNPMEGTLNVDVRRADEKVLSLLYSGMSYYGGAHGMYYCFGENYDTQTGEKLKLSDVVNDVSGLYELVSECLDLYWSEVPFFEGDYLKELFENEESIIWTLDYHGISFYFNPYDLAPFAYGILSVTLTKEDYPEVLKEEYLDTPREYAVELTNGISVFYDAYNDGTTDQIVVYSNSNEESYVGQIMIYVNDMLYDEITYNYGTEFTLIRTKDGKMLVLAELLHENDYKTIEVYEIASGIVKLGTIDGGLRRTHQEYGEFWYARDVLTNPESFIINSRTELISTVIGNKVYEIAKDGMPVTYDELFVFDEENAPELTALLNIETEIYDMEKGDVTGSRIINAGESVFYCATDNIEYAYFKCSDGTVVRKHVTIDDSYAHIDGIGIYDVFSGLIFAG